MTHVTCTLTAKNRDQLRNPTVGNRVWASFTFTLFIIEFRQRARLVLLGMYSMHVGMENVQGVCSKGVSGRHCDVVSSSGDEQPRVVSK